MPHWAKNYTIRGYWWVINFPSKQCWLMSFRSFCFYFSSRIQLNLRWNGKFHCFKVCKSHNFLWGIESIDGVWQDATRSFIGSTKVKILIKRISTKYFILFLDVLQHAIIQGHRNDWNNRWPLCATKNGRVSDGMRNLSIIYFTRLLEVLKLSTP